MTHVKYFRISLLFPIIVGALLGLIALMLDLFGANMDLVNSIPAILFTGHLIMAVPYIIFALVVGKLLGNWSASKTIQFLLYTPIIFIITTYIIGLILDFQTIMKMALVISAVSSVFYVSLILGIYFIGKKQGWIINNS